uniref:Alpha-1,4 glucan phosphorylase L-1 isozyme, chloroplastic/amyloplastic n=1 Tax=Tanacetum cinerariifolium TaxID=118510 RepID=A0A6L2M2I2_TANCI|nr:alpha-1,4 glucan phosphorylase L-1 isozyme, chloroplastic/amyloplastic [Tanacetum cinerariifolium]
MYERINTKQAYYLSMEFLQGRALSNVIANLKLIPIVVFQYSLLYVNCHVFVYFSSGHIFAPTAIVNNMSSIVVGSRGSSGQRVSSKRQCVHPSGSISSCKIDQQPSSVGTMFKLSMSY